MTKTNTNRSIRRTFWQARALGLLAATLGVLVGSCVTKAPEVLPERRASLIVVLDSSTSSERAVDERCGEAVRAVEERWPGESYEILDVLVFATGDAPSGQPRTLNDWTEVRDRFVAYEDPARRRARRLEQLDRLHEDCRQGLQATSTTSIYLALEAALQAASQRTATGAEQVEVLVASDLRENFYRPVSEHLRGDVPGKVGRKSRAGRGRKGKKGTTVAARRARRRGKANLALPARLESPSIVLTFCGYTQTHGDAVSGDARTVDPAHVRKVWQSLVRAARVDFVPTCGRPYEPAPQNGPDHGRTAALHSGGQAP